MDIMSDFAAWAWARHHNEWSWWLRPLFLLPFCWFAWRRSIGGIALTLLALLTSMFWFPAPQTPSAQAVEVLALERDYLLGPWTWWRIAIAALVPLFFAALALAFWQRSFWWGLWVVNLMAGTKIAWTFVFFTEEGALYHLIPAAVGLAICNVTLIAGWRWLARSTRASPDG